MNNEPDGEKYELRGTKYEITWECRTSYFVLRNSYFVLPPLAYSQRPGKIKGMMFYHGRCMFLV